MLGGTAFGIIGLLFLLAAIRTFTSTLNQAFFGELPSAVIGAIAFGVFATSFGAIVVAARLGPRRAIAGSGTLLAVSTLLGAAARNEWLDLLLSAAAIAAGTWWLALTHAARSPSRSSPFGVAVPAALVIDAALRSAFGTTAFVDGPPPITLPLTLIAVLLFLASGLAHASVDLTWGSPGPRGALGLIALAPLLFVSETGGGNAAQVAAAGGLGLGPESAHSTQIGAMLVGLGAGLGAFLLTRDLPRRPIGALAIGLGALLVWSHLPVLSLAGGPVFAAGILIAASALVAAPPAEARTPALTVVALGLGWLLFVGAAFGFYAYYAYLPAAWAATALVAFAVLAVPPVAGPRWGLGAAILVTALAVLVPLTALLTLPAASSAEPPATFRVMTYNVHQGYDAGNVPSLDALVDTIAREGPDVVVLQEVVRGWLIDGQHDVAGVLAARLGMSYVFGPNIGDLYGNAVLSRYPMTEVRRVAYAKEPGDRYQPRGAILVDVAGVLVVATHLDEHADASAVRLEQVRTLLREWNGRQPAIIACDCNALPEAPELALIDAAGFGDLAAQAGGLAPTFPAGAPRERIDYLFGNGVQASQAHVVDSTASDHRALVVNVTRTAP
ncbi:MAG TPA: endonuclease/exonuclease/phosphatase family protein [Candidatus Limnocylindria bacterium]